MHFSPTLCYDVISSLYLSLSLSLSLFRSVFLSVRLSPIQVVRSLLLLQNFRDAGLRPRPPLCEIDVYISSAITASASDRLSKRTRQITTSNRAPAAEGRDQYRGGANEISFSNKKRPLAAMCCRHILIETHK